MSNRSIADQQERLSTDLCRQIRTPVNARFLRALPAFKVEQDLPRDLIELLREMDRVEHARAAERRAS